MVLAIDPGTVKLGWAIVDKMGIASGQGVIPFTDWDSQLRRLVSLDQVSVVVLGNGTNRVNIKQGLMRLLPQVKIVLVDETASTVDAWQLKREEEAGSNPFRQLIFILRQLFVQMAVDDYAARILAMRYLNQSPSK